MGASKRKVGGKSGGKSGSSSSGKKGSVGSAQKGSAVPLWVAAAAAAVLAAALLSLVLSSSPSPSPQPSNANEQKQPKRKRERVEPKILAERGSVLDSEWWDVPCTKTRAGAGGAGGAAVLGCTPVDRCGRFVTDVAFDEAQLLQLKAMAKKWIMMSPGAAGGPTILDLHSGALSYEDQFIDVYQEVGRKNANVYDPTDFAVYTAIKNTILDTVETQFNIKPGLVYLTKPTFFSEISNKPARTEHDEYWHVHVDKVTYGSFDYTCLLYLSDYQKDFEGGQFWFENKTSKVGVEPRLGRLSCFTSGAENAHHIAQVTSGKRFALTVAFSCDADAAIADPTGDRASTSAAVPE